MTSSEESIQMPSCENDSWIPEPEYSDEEEDGPRERDDGPRERNDDGPRERDDGPRERNDDGPRERDDGPRERDSYSPRPPEPPPKDLIKFDYTVSLGQVDIIFVIDNSSSMAIEHQSLAKQFNTFLNAIKNADYHIAVITTDISSSSGNSVRNAYYQDGKFIPIGRRVYLRNENLGGKASSSVLEEFKRAIVRKETERCDTSNQPTRSSGKYDDLWELDEDASIECPSHDERGTYALNLALRNQKHQSFFRPKAHLMVVILSDEDVRSSREHYVNQLGFEQADLYAFEDFDHPEVLVENIHNRFPFKSASFYPIIIIPRDSACLNQQNRHRSGGQGTGRGFYGVEYDRLAKAQQELTRYGNLLRGKSISICDKNYGSQLNKIAMEANTIKVSLPCGQPRNVYLYVNERRTRANYKIEARTLIIEPGKISLDANLRLAVWCDAN